MNKSRNNIKDSASLLADAIAQAVASGTYDPFGKDHFAAPPEFAPAVDDMRARLNLFDDVVTLSPLDEIASGALAQLLTISVMVSTKAEVEQDLVSRLYSLRRRYPQLADMISFVIIRVQNLQVKPMANLQDYYSAPQGSIREVTRKMLASGVPEPEVKRQVTAYKSWMTGAIEPSIQSGELFKRLIFLSSR